MADQSPDLRGGDGHTSNLPATPDPPQRIARAKQVAAEQPELVALLAEIEERIETFDDGPDGVWWSVQGAVAILDALAAAGLEVRPVVDDQTRAEVADRVRILRDLSGTVGVSVEGMNFAAVAPFLLVQVADLLERAYLGDPT